MKKIFALTVAFIAGFALTANAGSIGPGQMTKCTDAKSITFERRLPTIHIEDFEKINRLLKIMDKFNKTL